MLSCAPCIDLFAWVALGSVLSAQIQVGFGRRGEIREALREFHRP